MLLMSTGKSVSASMNVIIATSGPAALCMPGPNSDFGNSIEDDFIEFLMFSAV